MGFFGTRKDHSKEQCPALQQACTTLSPQSAPKRSSSRIPRLGVLFSDTSDIREDQGPRENSDLGNTTKDELSAPTIDMDDFETCVTVKVKSVSAMPARGNSVQDDTRKLASAAPSPIHKSIRGSGIVGRQDAILRRANSISRMVQRDSIKRSVSRKIARSECRRQNLTQGSDADPRSPEKEQNRFLSMPQPSTDSDEEIEKTGRGSTPCNLSMLNDSLEDVHISSPRNEMDADFDNAYCENDIFLVEEATRNDFDLRAVSGIASEAINNSGQTVPYEIGKNSQKLENNQAEVAKALKQHQLKPAKVRKRPPPLVSASSEKSSGDSISDWPHTTLFGKDGGFATGGFKITEDGMVGLPQLVTREDSDSQAEDGVPQSDRNLIIVRSLKEFQAGPTIGAGAAGRVYIAEHIPSKRTMAIKVVNVYDKEKRNQLLKELETLCTYVSRYLVRFYGAFYDGSGAVHIALEYMDHGCLSTFVQRVGPIPEKVVQMIAVDCLRGLRFLHRNHVLHRDFKTANILLSRRLCCAKLSDFGLARDLNPGVSRVETFVGTVAYMSPERLQGSKYTYASDIWAVGVSLVECLLGRYPFDRPQNYFDYIEATMTSNMWSGFEHSGIKVSSAARDFMMLCTQTEPTQRPNAEKLLQHPWIINLKRDRELFGSWLDHCRIISMKVPLGLVVSGTH